MHLILASESPRRAELLKAAGIDFEVVPAHVDESILPGEMPDAYVRRIAEAKARAVVPRSGSRPVLAADTAVVVADMILGKPADAADAMRMLRLLSGRQHDVVTAVCLARCSTSGVSTTDVRLETTVVWFSDVSDEEIEAYVGTVEPFDKAGGYAIQGWASRFITRIEGSYSNVVGLPVALVYQMLEDSGAL